MAQSSVFPIYLRAEYRGDGLKEFVRQAGEAAAQAKREFQGISAALDQAISRGRTGTGSLDLGVGEMRQAALAQEQIARAAREVADATNRAATANGAYNAELGATARAAEALASSEAKAAQALFQQVSVLEAVQNQLNQTASATTVLIGENLRLAQAEAAAVNGANMVQATLRGTALEADRAANSARESASAFEILFQAQAARSSASAQNFFNAAAGLDRQAKSARDSARAFEEMFAAQEKAAAAQRSLEQSTAALRAELDPMFAAQQRFDQELERADRLFKAGAISAREYAQAQQLARNNLREAAQAATATGTAIERVRKVGTTATQSVVNSARAERTAFIQLGQQLQDISIQAQMGTNAFLIFGQQVPQAAFALSGLAASADKTKAAVGRFATFMSGPFGALIFVGIAALGPLVMKLFETGEEADKARTKVFNFADGLDVLKLSAEDATNAMDQLIGSLRSAITLQGSLVRGNIQIAEQEATRLRAAIDADQAELNRLRQGRDGIAPNLLPSVFGPTGAVLRKEAEIEARLKANREKLGPALEAAGVAAVAKANRAVAEAADPLQKQINDIDDAIARLNRRRELTVIRNDLLANDNISDADFTKQLGDLARQRAELEQAQRDARKKPPKPKKPKIDREPEQLKRFADQSFEQVLRINDRFAEQTRLIQQSLQATRQLDGIIGEINGRMAKAKNLTKAQREEFERIKQAALDAQTTIDDALVRPFEDLRLESQRRLDIETLLAQGKVDEAAAAQVILQLERELGEEVALRREIERLILAGRTEEAAKLKQFVDRYADLKEDIRDQILLEQQKTRELRAQAELLELQADVARTVANDLRSILSGRSTDFFGNFRQALLDLQGARLFEKLFGPAFQQLEQELAGNTPQGRANARYVAEVEKTAATTVRVEQALSSLVDTLTAENDRLTRGMLPGYPFGANDNEITVNGTRPPPAEFAQKSIKDIAREISREAVKPGVELLSRLIGRELAGSVGNIAAGVIEGQARAGTVGGVLGGLEQLTGSIEGLEGVSKKLGEALDGAQTGTTVNAIGNALGLRGSALGAQIGGAAGAFIPIPGGDIIGAIAGNFLGALISGIPKGSATINGVGVNSVVGNRGSLREAASGLGGNVNDMVSEIARRLGGRVTGVANPVSIGIRDGDFRVDPTGRGTTRVKGGAIDFGEDQEAAVRFATQLLIERGVIAGIKASEQRLLQAGKTLEDGLRDILDFRNVFDRLKEIRDPVGFAVERLNREFERLIDLFERAGASAEEFADLRDLYDLERARAIEEANNRVIGSLRALLNELTIGNSGLSLRSRQQNALTQFDALAARVAAGDTTAFDDFADISKQLLDIERQLFGSTQSYFDRLAQITALTERAVADQTNITSIASAQPSPFPDRAEIVRSIDIMNADVVGMLKAINDNLIALDQSRSVGSDFRNEGYFGLLNTDRFVFPNTVAAF